MKKKKGSSLILVLMIFSILIIFGIAVLSLALSTYQKRILQNTAKKNFYSAETGIDVAYDIIAKNVDAAIEDGNNAVNNFINGLKLDEESPYVNSDGTINEKALREEEQNEFASSYEKYINDNLINSLNNSSNYENYNIDNVSDLTITTDDQPAYFDDSNKLFSVNITSNYKEKNVAKAVKATYQIKVPAYGEKVSAATNTVSIPLNPVWSKAINVNGDMLVDDNLSVNGDIFVKGSEDDDSGIKIGAANNSKCTLNVSGRLITDNSVIAAGKDSSLNINGNVYAKDVKIEEEADSSRINVNADGKFNGSVFTSNDLSLNASSSKIYIYGGYYGLSDGSQDSDPGHSSSIYVNSDDIGAQNGSAIYIGKEAYIMGSAYINLDNSQKYQTGESVAIKGNYMTYTYPLTGEEAVFTDSDGKKISMKQDNVIFDYISPLQLANRFIDPARNMNIFEKSFYFIYSIGEYFNDKNINGLEIGRGVTLPQNNIHAVASVVGNGGSLLSPSTFSIDDNDVIKNKTIEFNKMAYEMGDASSEPDVSLNNPQKTIGTQVNFSAIPDGFQDQIADSSKVIILKKDIGDVYINTSGTPAEYGNTITLNNDSKGIIIVKGNLHIIGKLNFAGTIITDGNLYIDDTGAKTITYDDLLVKNLIANNYSILKGVFNNNSSTIVPVITSINIQGNSVADKLISRKNWQLVK
jgi:Tfp pilus assembly protein PilX